MRFLGNYKPEIGRALSQLPGEAVNKKSVFLVVGPQRPLPPPLGLSGHRNFFVML